MNDTHVLPLVIGTKAKPPPRAPAKSKKQDDSGKPSFSHHLGRASKNDGKSVQPEDVSDEFRLRARSHPLANGKKVALEDPREKEEARESRTNGSETGTPPVQIAISVPVSVQESESESESESGNISLSIINPDEDNGQGIYQKADEISVPAENDPPKQEASGLKVADRLQADAIVSSGQLQALDLSGSTHMVNVAIPHQESYKDKELVAKLEKSTIVEGAPHTIKNVGDKIGDPLTGTRLNINEDGIAGQTLKSDQVELKTVALQAEVIVERVKLDSQSASTETFSKQEVNQSANITSPSTDTPGQHRDAFTQPRSSELTNRDGTNDSITHPPPEVMGQAVRQQVNDLQRMEPARLAEAHHPEIVEQLSRGIDTLTKTGQQSIRLQLYPENMGKIDMSLASDMDGVRIVIIADISTTSQLLERHLPELRQVLTQSGVNLSGLSVGYNDTQRNLSGSNIRQLASRQFRKKGVGVPGIQDTKTNNQKRILSMSNIDYRI
jgi:flagellar hook-length control protein FliK